MSKCAVNKCQKVRSKEPIRTSLTNQVIWSRKLRSLIYSALAWLWSSFWSFLDCEMVFDLTFSHFFGEPVDFSLGRTENDGLGDGQGIVEIAKCVELPFFTFNSDKELFDTFQCQFITLDEDSDWIRHELVSHLQDFVWQSSRYQDNLKRKIHP